MSTQLDTRTDERLDTGNIWPPLAHIIRKENQPAKEGDLAICGAKLMGLDLPDAKKMCKKCIEIARRELNS